MQSGTVNARLSRGTKETVPLYFYIYMLWFKFILGLMFFELVSILLQLFQIMIMNTGLGTNGSQLATD